MRILDYGEPDNDWLGLDLKRVNAPTKNLSNNIILLEDGSIANTATEAKLSAKYIARVIAEYINEN